jgi:hypothetical protein
MANPSGTNFKRAPSSTTFYQIRGAALRNSRSDALGLNGPLFFIGSVIIAVIIFAIREHNRSITTGIGLVVTNDPNSEVSNIENLTQSIENGVLIRSNA